MTSPSWPGAPQVGVARQGIFDRGGSLIGYEMLFRLPPAEQAPVLETEAEHERATADVITAVLELEAGAVNPEVLLFVNFPRAFLVGDLPLRLSADRLVVEVLEHVVPDSELIAGVQAIRRRGYRVAVDDWDGDRLRSELIAEAEYVKIDLAQVGSSVLAELVARARGFRPDIKVVVERLEDAADLDVARDSGADLFQGFYLEAPRFETVG